MAEIYSENDVLILPSRAESMPLVILEALSHGLLIVDSEDIALGLGGDIEYPVKSFNEDEYVKVLLRISKREKNYKEEVSNFFKHNFSDEIISKQLSTKVFN